MDAQGRAGLPSRTERGPLVPRQRPKASDDQLELGARPVRTRTSSNPLTRAEVRALSRGAPLTMAEFRAQRLLADQRIAPLRVVLDMPAVDALEGPAVDSPEA
jgi:hypothetical protein